MFLMGFRYANRAGHGYGPIELNLKYELYGSLHKTRNSLAETGQSKGKGTNLFPVMDASRCLHFTSLQCDDSDMNCVTGFFFFFNSHGH